MMAQAGSRCGSWIVSTPETALSSAGEVDVGSCRAPEGEASTERIWPVSSHDGAARRATPTAGSSARTITDPGVLEEQASVTRARGYASEDGEYRGVGLRRGGDGCLGPRMGRMLRQIGAR